MSNIFFLNYITFQNVKLFISTSKLAAEPGPIHNSSTTHFWAGTHRLRNAALELELALRNSALLSVAEPPAGVWLLRRRCLFRWDVSLLSCEGRQPASICGGGAGPSGGGGGVAARAPDPESAAPAGTRL